MFKCEKCKKELEEREKCSCQDVEKKTGTDNEQHNPFKVGRIEDIITDNFSYYYYMRRRF